PEFARDEVTVAEVQHGTRRRVGSGRGGQARPADAVDEKGKYDPGRDSTAHAGNAPSGSPLAPLRGFRVLSSADAVFLASSYRFLPGSSYRFLPPGRNCGNR